jgi:tetratricopeptide (TPR) repeat protein
MLNVLIALAIAAVFGSWVGVYSNWIAGLVLGFVAGVVAWVFLLRRTANKLTARMGEVEKHLQAARFEPAIKALEDAKQLKLWQFGLIRALDGQIGMLMYVKGQDLEGARTRLERAPLRNPAAQAMLGALAARQKRWDDATKVFERALKKNKKSSLLWGSYAWCQWKRGQAKDAVEILGRASLVLKSDENIKKNLQNLQNGKKMKMNGWGNEWWSLRLEPPPQQLASPAQMHPAMARAAARARKQKR